MVQVGSKTGQEVKKDRKWNRKQSRIRGRKGKQSRTGSETGTGNKAGQEVRKDQEAKKGRKQNETVWPPLSCPQLSSGLSPPHSAAHGVFSALFS